MSNKTEIRYLSPVDIEKRKQNKYCRFKKMGIKYIDYKKYIPVENIDYFVDSIQNQIDLLPILFYLGAIFWTLGYDTIYGYQDIKDDEIIGLKSTSIKFKGKEKKFLFTCYALLLIMFLIGGYLMKLNNAYYLLTVIPFLHLFFYQMKNFKSKDPISCLKVFKSNNMFGLIIFLNILIVKNL